MTRDEILAMKPGRELDACMAVAMGWKLTGPVNPDCDFSTGIHGCENFGVNPKDGRETYIPHYSTSWGDMEEVVETVFAEGMIDISKRVGHYRIWSWVKGKGWESVVTQTAPHGACLSALLAVMEVQP